MSLNTAGSVVIGSKTIALQSSGSSMGLAGLIMGAFGSSGPFGSVTVSAPSSPVGSARQGVTNDTGAGVQVFEGRAARLKGLFSVDRMARSVFMTGFVGFVCLMNSSV